VRISGVTTAEPASSRINIKKWLSITAVVLVAGIVLAIAIGFGTSKRVNGSSMRPTLRAGDRVLVDTSAYHKKGPSRLDVVALHAPRIKGLSVRRVIGVPGDRVQLRAVDGQPQVLVQPAGRGEWFIADPHRHVDWGDGPAVCCAADGTADGGGQVTVPAGKYFVLGDNPAASADSRTFGFVDRSAIVGRVSFRVWPPGRVGGRPKLVQLR
jgi:signal peptidase I